VEDFISRLRDIDHFAAFMKFLAPIARGPIDSAVRDGERTFSAVGCAACHIPALMTGSNVNPLFDRKVVPLYSDLLLHTIGTGDGIKQADSTASPDEMRTPALWGLRFRRPLLHVEGNCMNAIARFVDHVIAQRHHVPPTKTIATETSILDTFGVGDAGGSGPAPRRHEASTEAHALGSFSPHGSGC
jgi:hypothetical protein